MIRSWMRSCKASGVELKLEMNAMEEIIGDTNTLGGDSKFGGDTEMIWDSGAGRHLCAHKARAGIPVGEE